MPTVATERRKLGRTGPEVFPLGLGCMGMSGIYGAGSDRESLATMEAALDAGVNLLDTSDFYSKHRNEMLIAKVLRSHRNQVVLSVKFNAPRAPMGVWLGIAGRQAALKTALTSTMKRLGVDFIDIYRLGRLDPDAPIEETLSTLSQLMQAGYVRHIGLSGMAPEEVRRAAAMCPIVDLQVEYSLVSRGPEAKLFPRLNGLGVGATVIGVHPRALSSSSEPMPGEEFRARLPRFKSENRDRSRLIGTRLEEIAGDRGITQAQLAMAWVLAKQSWVVPLMTARTRAQLAEALGALEVELTSAEVAAIEAAITAKAMAEARTDREQIKAPDRAVARTEPAEQAAEQGRIEAEIEVKHPQGLKPNDDLVGFGGTTKVVPCYKAPLPLSSSAPSEVVLCYEAPLPLSSSAPCEVVPCCEALEPVAEKIAAIEAAIPAIETPGVMEAAAEKRTEGLKIQSMVRRISKAASARVRDAMRDVATRRKTAPPREKKRKEWPLDGVDGPPAENEPAAEETAAADAPIAAIETAVLVETFAEPHVDGLHVQTVEDEAAQTAAADPLEALDGTAAVETNSALETVAAIDLPVLAEASGEIYPADPPMQALEDEQTSTPEDALPELEAELAAAEIVLAEAPAPAIEADSANEAAETLKEDSPAQDAMGETELAPQFQGVLDGPQRTVEAVVEALEPAAEAPALAGPVAEIPPGGEKPQSLAQRVSKAASRRVQNALRKFGARGNTDARKEKTRQLDDLEDALLEPPAAQEAAAVEAPVLAPAADDELKDEVQAPSQPQAGSPLAHGPEDRARREAQPADGGRNLKAEEIAGIEAAIPAVELLAPVIAAAEIESVGEERWTEDKRSENREKSWMQLAGALGMQHLESAAEEAFEIEPALPAFEYLGPAEEVAEASAEAFLGRVSDDERISVLPAEAPSTPEGPAEESVAIQVLGNETLDSAEAMAETPALPMQTAEGGNAPARSAQPEAAPEEPAGAEEIAPIEAAIPAIGTLDTVEAAAETEAGTEKRQAPALDCEKTWMQLAETLAELPAKPAAELESPETPFLEEAAAGARKRYPGAPRRARKKESWSEIHAWATTLHYIPRETSAQPGNPDAG